MDRAIGDGIGILLETFQELTRKGNQATLFLEARNGKQFGTLKVKSYPVKPEEPSKWRKNKRKSPSTVRRGQRILTQQRSRPNAKKSHVVTK